MGLAACLFHWPPDVFWSSTPHEFWAAWQIWREMNPPQDDGNK